MVIRPATHNDILKVSRLWLKLVQETMPEQMHPNVNWWRKIAEYKLNTGNYYIFVAEEGGSVVGFTSFTIGPEPATGKIVAQGQHIYVQPEYRKGRVGSMLHKENLKCAKENGATAWMLTCAKGEESIWSKKGFGYLQTMMIKDMEE